MKKLVYIFLLLHLLSCSKPLEEQVFSSFGPNNFFKTADDAEALLNAAYSLEQKQGTDGFRNIFVMAEVTTDMIIIREGGLRGLAQPLEDFTWNASHEFFDVGWTRYYSAIYRANVAIDNVPTIAFDEERKKQIVAEARFLRASGYIYLYDLFGPTPIITSSISSSEDRPVRATKEEFIKFVTDELTAVSDILPVTAKQYGRATKGAALAFLTKFYLNNKNWAKANETAQKVIDLKTYSLFNAANRSDLFKLANEKNSEFIYVRPHIAQPGLGTNYLAHAAPPNYKFKGAAKANYATQFKTLSGFYDSFDPKDQRRQVFLTEYDDLSGKRIVLGQDDKRSFKFEEDLPATAADMGNDFPVVRYADILLSKAEALNEINGPSQEVIELINQVRVKAGVDPLKLADFASKDLLRSHILKERGWEFFTEELRRQDLIRHGKFIELAKGRGKVAFDYQNLFPIPQSEIDRNPSLKQNEGYK
jgi:hypothetical protein